MSFSIDANILIYAAQDDSQHHAGARAFLRKCVDAGEVFYVTWPALLAFLRITTHPRIFRRPLSMEAALADVRELISQPHVLAVGEDETFLDRLDETCRGAGIRGAMVSDAHVAAILRQHGVRVIYTLDADFRRFDGLDVRNPL